MASLRSASLLLVCLAALSSAEPIPCCVPKNFTIKLFEVVNDVDFGVVTSLEQTVHKAYDAINELEADILFQFNAETGATETTKTIYIYSQSAKYVIKGDTCTKEPLTEPFSEFCVPSTAEYFETYTSGLGKFANDGFHLTTPGQTYDEVYDFFVSTEKCIPYVFSARRAPPSGPAPPVEAQRIRLPFQQSRLAPGEQAPLAVRAQYYDYEEGIADPSFWFKPPAQCKSVATKEQKESAMKMAGRLMAKFKGKKFVVV